MTTLTLTRVTAKGDYYQRHCIADQNVSVYTNNFIATTARYDRPYTYMYDCMYLCMCVHTWVHTTTITRVGLTNFVDQPFGLPQRKLNNVANSISVSVAVVYLVIFRCCFSLWLQQQPLHRLQMVVPTHKFIYTAIWV